MNDDETIDVVQDTEDTVYDQGKVAMAFNTVKQAMMDDEPEVPGSYAHGWHCQQPLG